MTTSYPTIMSEKSFILWLCLVCKLLRWTMPSFFSCYTSYMQKWSINLNLLGKSLYKMQRLHKIQAGERENCGQSQKGWNWSLAEASSWFSLMFSEVALALTICRPDNYTWPVDKLKNASRTVLASNAELPHELLELREKEIQPITEVNNN